MAREVVPKKNKCTQCGFISNKTKLIKMPGITFAVCFKCGGRLIDNPQWLDWLREQRARTRQEAIENNGGYIMGVKIN